MTSETTTSDLDSALRTLSDTLNKDDGIVNTSSASRFLDRPENIEEKYQKYARTHLIQADISRTIETLQEKLNDTDDDRSVPGYIVGPYGYGKTSTAGKIWYQLEHEGNHIATPPIYFDEIQSIVDAVYGWMRYRLEGQSPELVDALEDSYEAQVTNNLGDLLDSTDIEDKDSVRTELEELRDRGALDVEFTVSNVLEFLSECNSIAKEAGYDGLVVIADELQQFVSNHPSDKDAYAQLRDIAKSIALGLNEGDGLGLLFTMDDGLHGDLNINADDVLARLAEQNVTINLQNVYERSFPDNLWESLSEKYGFKDDRYSVISKDALDAMGQICERGPPISNGPRTVVDLLTIAIDHYLSEDRVFDALSLAEAYYNGIVRYKSDRIKTAITEAINTEEVRTPEHEAVIKLCGVFLRGVSDERFDQYGLLEAKDQIKQPLHGFILITHEEGRTLKDLEREGEDRGVKDELFTRFYQKYDTTDVHYENATEVFRQVVVESELFPSKRGTTLSSWRTKHEFEPETGGVYSAVFHGSFNGQEYPKRNVQVRVGPSEEAVTIHGTTQPDIDFTIGFILSRNGEPDPHITRQATDKIFLHLDLMREFDSLPSNIALLENYMSPEDVTPHLLLSLHKYMDEWEADHSINPSQEDQLEFIKDQIINQSIQQLFGAPLNSDSFFGIDNPRRALQPTKVVPKIFSRVISDVYPEYTTLFVSDNYDSFLEEYEDLLLDPKLDLRISQKRGSTPIEVEKQAFVEAMGLRSTATAETHLSKQLSSLAKIEDWTGSDEDLIRIRLTLHPLETRLLDVLEDASDENLSRQKAYKLGKEEGHRNEEVDWAIRLLEARDYVETNDSNRTIELIDIAIDPKAVRQQITEFRETTNKISEITGEWPRGDEILVELDEIEEETTEATEEDIELLDECNAQLQGIQRTIRTKLTELQTRTEERCRTLKEQFSEFRGRSKPQDLTQPPQKIGVPFEMHLSDLREELNADINSLQNVAETKESQLAQELKELDGSPSIEQVEQLQRTQVEADSKLSELESQWEEVEKKAHDFREWCDLSTDMSNCRSQMVRYEKNHDGTTAVAGLIESFDNILTEIQSEFQSDTEETITDAGVYRERFEEIQEEFEDITEGDRENFTYRKNVLDNTITEGTNERGRIRQTLDPNDPESSRNNIKKDFTEALHHNDGGIKDTEELIESVRTKLEYCEYLNMVPASPEQSPEEIRATLQDAEEQLKTITHLFSDLSIKRDIDLPESDDRTADFPATDRRLTVSENGQLIDVGGILRETRTTCEDIEEQVQRWRRTTEEVPTDLEYLHNLINYDQSTDLEQILINLRDDEGSIEMKAVFEDLQRLFEDNHISISVSSEHRE